MDNQRSEGPIIPAMSGQRHGFEIVLPGALTGLSHYPEGSMGRLHG